MYIMKQTQILMVTLFQTVMKELIPLICQIWNQPSKVNYSAAAIITALQWGRCQLHITHHGSNLSQVLPYDCSAPSQVASDPNSIDFYKISAGRRGACSRNNVSTRGWIPAAQEIKTSQRRKIHSVASQAEFSSSSLSFSSSALWLW